MRYSVHRRIILQWVLKLTSECELNNVLGNVLVRGFVNKVISS